VTLGSLDYLYTPSRDVAADAAQLVHVLGGRLVFAIEDGGARVAMVELGPAPPAIVLNDHLDGDRPILVYRVADLAETRSELAARAWFPEHSLEIPQGPLLTFRTPGGQRLAVYELTRPFVLESFAGRRDF
jgi:hypothetical protein